LQISKIRSGPQLHYTARHHKMFSHVQKKDVTQNTVLAMTLQELLK